MKTDVVEKLLALTEKDYGPGTKMWIHGAMVEVCQELLQLRAEVARLRSALEWYADLAEPSMFSEEELTAVARQALE